MNQVLLIALLAFIASVDSFKSNIRVINLNRVSASSPSSKTTFAQSYQLKPSYHANTLSAGYKILSSIR